LLSTAKMVTRTHLSVTLKRTLAVLLKNILIVINVIKTALDTLHTASVVTIH
jgi:hypothetical protein